MCSAGTNDYQMFAWIAAGSSSTTPWTGAIYWCAIEKSTGNFVHPPTLVNFAPAAAQFLRLAVVGTRWVMCWAENSVNPGVIQCATITEAGLTGLSGIGWTSPSGGIVTSNTAFDSAFDMRAVTGDSTYFTLAYSLGSRDAYNIVVDQRPAASPATLTKQWVVESNVNATLTSFGLRSDLGVNNRVAVAYCEYQTDTSYVIRAATGNYPAMTTSKGPANIYTSIDAGEAIAYPLWLDITYGGTAGSTGGTATWTVTHSPWGSVWTAWSTLPQLQTNRLNVGTVPGDSSADARIIQNQFFEGSTTVVGWSNTSGTNACITPGVILASRGYEQNGIAYFLAWVPSLTQGSFIVLAYDLAQNPEVSVGSAIPMRPVGTLQTRTALADPGAGSEDDQTTPAPNTWTGACDWTPISEDLYGTATVGYVGGTQGQRLQPAYGKIQFQPTTGFPYTQYGTMTAIGGPLPLTFAGQNAVEQGYLYCPESIIATVNTSGSPPTSGPTWTLSTDSYSWIFCWEWFDEQGNFHQSARSTPVTITGAPLQALTFTLPVTLNPIFSIPALGVTLRQWPAGATNMFTFGTSAPPSSYPTLGAYRTGVSSGPVASTYLRITDRFYNNADPRIPPGTLPPLTINAYPTSYSGPFEVTFTDTVNDGTPGGDVGINDGTHPLLYGDGSDGAPGSLDNFNPPSTNVLVRHKERLFVARGNELLFTKQRSELEGPGYDEEVNSIFVGNDDEITGLESQDGNLVILKASQNYYVAGDGPADDGSGSSFSAPQPIPTDLGCVGPDSVIGTPEGVFYMSTGGLRRVSRSLSVDYVGGPVEDELSNYSTVTGVVLYPQNNRVLFLANDTDVGNPQLYGEVLVRDYALDAWTTAVVMDGATQKGFVSAAVAIGEGTGGRLFTVKVGLCMHFLTADGVVWREHNPLDQFAYFDNATYVSWTWLSPPIYPPGSTQQPTTKQGRFRLWDILAEMESDSPHGLVISVAIDNGAPAQNRTWTWNTPGSPSIAPGGTTPTPLTQLRTYDGRMGETFQVQVQDVSDPNSTNGQGAQFLGLTLALGVYPGPYKLPASATQ